MSNFELPSLIYPTSQDIENFLNGNSSITKADLQGVLAKRGIILPAIRVKEDIAKEISSLSHNQQQLQEIINLANIDREDPATRWATYKKTTNLDSIESAICALNKKKEGTNDSTRFAIESTSNGEIKVIATFRTISPQKTTLMSSTLEQITLNITMEDNKTIIETNGPEKISEDLAALIFKDEKVEKEENFESLFESPEIREQLFRSITTLPGYTLQLLKDLKLSKPKDKKKNAHRVKGIQSVNFFGDGKDWLDDKKIQELKKEGYLPTQVSWQTHIDGLQGLFLITGGFLRAIKNPPFEIKIGKKEISQNDGGYKKQEPLPDEKRRITNDIKNVVERLKA